MASKQSKRVTINEVKRSSTGEKAGIDPDNGFKQKFSSDYHDRAGLHNWQTQKEKMVNISSLSSESLRQSYNDYETLQNTKRNFKTPESLTIQQIKKLKKEGYLETDSQKQPNGDYKVNYCNQFGACVVGLVSAGLVTAGLVYKMQNTGLGNKNKTKSNKNKTKSNKNKTRIKKNKTKSNKNKTRIKK